MCVIGWDCTFGKWSGDINVPDRPKLLLGFFQYYSNRKELQNQVLSTLVGKSIKKQKFYPKFCKSQELNEIQRDKFISYQSKISTSFAKHYGLAIHDPFELSFNITKNITNDILTDFCELCDQTETLLSNTKGYLNML